MTSILHCKGLTKTFGSTVALDGIDLDLGSGVTGLLGPNGAGKTTLLRLAATVMAPDNGDLRVIGRDPAMSDDRLAIRRRLGYLPQEPGFHQHFTAFEFVDYVAILKEYTDRRSRHDEVRRVLTLVGLDDVMHKRIKTLSGGMRRRVAIAQALLGAPELLLLDEPTAGLDPEQRLRFRELLGDHGSQAAVVLSTHQTDDVAALCQRVVVLLGGRVYFDGTPAELASIADGRVWLASERDAHAELAWVTAEGRVRHVGAPPPGAEPVQPTVEDGYLLLAGSAGSCDGGRLMRRVGRVAGSVAVVTALIALLVAGLVGFGGGLILLAPVGLVVVVVVYFRRSRTTEIGWSGTGTAVATAPLLLPQTESPANPRVVAAAPRGGGIRVAGSLAGVEARELIASPWLHVGVAFWLVILGLLGVLFVDDVDRSWFEFFGIATLICHPFTAFAIVAAHRNRTRSRRDRCDELFDACPADADTRTLGHLATAWVAALINAVFILLLFALVATRSSHIYGPIGAYVVAAVLACAVIGAGGVALGVTLGRWAPWGLVPFVAVVAIGVASDRINGIGAPAFATDRMLATLVATTGIDPIFLPQLWWERLAWLTAISLVVAALGLIGGRYARVAGAVLGGAAVVAVVSALLIVRPATGDADRIADLVADPVAHSTCAAAGPGVEVCAYDGYGELAEETAQVLEPIVDSVPDGVLRDVVFVAYYEQGTARLTAEVQDALGRRRVQLPKNALRLRFNAHPSNFDAARLRLAARAVGLPADAADSEYPTPVAGRAQGVIALWLATRGLEPEARDRFIAADESADPSTDVQAGAIWPGTCHEENQALQWSSTDIEAARVLFGIPDEQVQRALLERWDELTQRDATTDALLVAVGAQPLGPAEPVHAQHDICA